MTKHTAGPWQGILPKPIHLGHYAAGDAVRIRGRDSGSVVASVPVFSDNWEANGRLIAAAPDLLEALQIALVALDLDPENRPPQWSAKEAGERVRAAILKTIDTPFAQL